MKKLLLLLLITFTLGLSPAGAYYANSSDETQEEEKNTINNSSELDDPCKGLITRYVYILTRIDEIYKYEFPPTLETEKELKILESEKRYLSWAIKNCLRWEEQARNMKELNIKEEPLTKG